MESPQTNQDDPGRKRAGVIYATAAFVAWGILPLYFKAVGAVPTLEVLAHRIVWSVVFLVGLTLALEDAVRQQLELLLQLSSFLLPQGGVFDRGGDGLGQLLFGRGRGGLGLGSHGRPFPVCRG